MKITRINVEFMLDEGTAVDEFLSRLTGLSGAPVTIEHHPVPQAPVEQIAAANAAADTGSRRRRSTPPANPTNAGAAEPPASAPSAPDTGSRRRRAAPPAAAPDPMPINDAEMSKAASNAAEVLVNMGEDGPGMVMLILEDFGVRSAGEVPPDQRQKFLEECAKEIMLAKKDHGMAP